MMQKKAESFLLEQQAGGVVLRCGEKLLRIYFYSPSIVRVTYTEGRDFTGRSSRIVSANPGQVGIQVHQDECCVRLASSALTVEVNKDSGALTYLDAGGMLLTREPEGGGKWLTPKKIYRNIFEELSKVMFTRGVDGARAASAEHKTVLDRMAFEARLGFLLALDEALFGLGSHEEGYGNLRGKTRDLYQQNMKAVVPFLVSTRGYGVLLDCGSSMKFYDDADGAWWWADCVEELDYYFIYGADYKGVHRGYHWLSGSAPMLPKWALGYVQSKERYVNAYELIEVVQEYRRRQIPLDTIVLDWKSWPDGGGWGQKEFDPARFPEPDAMIEKLHDLGAHLMVSIWPLMTGDCANQRELLEQGFMLGNQSTYNAFSSGARACYWGQAKRGLFDRGVDAWWCDCTEPFEADWAGDVKPESDARFALNTDAAKLYLDAGEINSYSLLHSQGVYEGQRAVTSEKRVVNLTRSSYAGQHRYGTITWNGDICATWETLRRCIPEGLNFCASGEPYWTVDIGGFFIDSHPELWFWRGDYHDGCRGLTAMEAQEPDADDTGCRDLGYWELYTRWLQYAAFLPIFRSHGTDAPREIWHFGEEGATFYDVIASFIRLRYRLLPLLYSLVARVTLEGQPMLRALALTHPDDTATHRVDDQFLLGDSLMVCPVTVPMYYGVDSTVLEATEKTRKVYLPRSCDWYDYWTGELHQGGQWVTAAAPMERIPVFVPEGAILPLTEVMQYADEIPDAPYEIYVYTGRDGEFTLYEDKGDGYDYEQGKYALIMMRWSELTKELVLQARIGSFPEMVQARNCCVIFIAPGLREEHRITYRGEEIRVKKNGGMQKLQ